MGGRTKDQVYQGANFDAFLQLIKILGVYL